METTVAVETLERVTATLAELRSKHAGLLHELQGATQEVASLKTLREKFLVMASTGDGAAARHVLELEQKQLEAGRTVEGLQLRLDALAVPIQASEAEWTELAQQAATAERARKTEELAQEAERLAHNKIALWRAACRASFDESAFHAQVQATSGLSQQQRAQIRSAGLNVFDLSKASIYNEAWERGVTFTGTLTILPLRPPEELRYLEEEHSR